MKLIKSTLLSTLVLPAIVAHAAEKKVTIFTSDGYEKELIIDVPNQLAGQEDHYTKAYVLNYMKWWNMGIGTTKRNALKYQFDITHFEENTPPLQISAAARAAADRHFSKNDFWEKVIIEGGKFIDDINYKADSAEVTTEIIISPKLNYGTRLTLNIPPPPKKYSRRANEYVGQYAIYYSKLWNSIIRSDNPANLSLLDDRFSSYPYLLGLEEKYHSDNINVGGDIKSELKKLFESPEMRAKVIKDQMAFSEKRAKESKS